MKAERQEGSGAVCYFTLQRMETVWLTRMRLEGGRARVGRALSALSILEARKGSLKNLLSQGVASDSEF